MKLDTTFGFEMTGILKDAIFYEKNNGRRNEVKGCLSKPDTNMTAALSNLIAAKLIRWYPRSFTVKNYFDVHCAEFQSPIFRTSEQVRMFYQRTRKEMLKYDLLPHHPTAVCGGNHFHFGLDRKNNHDIRLVKSVFRDMVNRPYITWVFTQPDDTSSCSNYTAEKYTGNIIKNYRINPNQLAYGDRVFGDIMLSDNEQVGRELGKMDLGNLETKEYCVGVNDQGRYAKKRVNGERPYIKQYTLEFRCVEAPLDYSEFKDQFDFFYAYYKFHKKQSVNSIPMAEFMTPEEFQAIPMQTSIDEFNKILITLGLRPSRYAKYVKRNLIPRWQDGRERV